MDPKTFEITHYSTIKGVCNKNGIKSEPFTVGGYDWVIEFYPLGMYESVVDYISVSVKLLKETEEVQASFSFHLWDWTTSKWSLSRSTILIFSPPLGQARKGFDSFINRSAFEGSNLLKDDTLIIKCNVLVIPRPPALKPDVDFGYGFNTARYTPTNAPSNEYTKLPRQPTVRIYCEANKDISITARNGGVMLAPADSNDHYQHWIKDMSYGDKVKDASGIPAFALVNRVTGQALKNPAGENQEVSLVPYNKNRLDNSMKWTEMWSTDFRPIRIANKTSLNLTAAGSRNLPSSNFSDGAKIVVKKFVYTPVQHWKIVPYNSNVPC